MHLGLPLCAFDDRYGSLAAEVARTWASPSDCQSVEHKRLQLGRSIPSSLYRPSRPHHHDCPQDRMGCSPSEEPSQQDWYPANSPVIIP